MVPSRDLEHLPEERGHGEMNPGLSKFGQCMKDCEKRAYFGGACDFECVVQVEGIDKRQTRDSSTVLLSMTFGSPC